MATTPRIGDYFVSWGAALTTDAGRRSTSLSSRTSAHDTMLEEYYGQRAEEAGGRRWLVRRTPWMTVPALRRGRNGAVEVVSEGTWRFFARLAHCLSCTATNPSIEAALVDLLGKPIAESRALCIPTAQWGHPMLGPESVRSFVVGGPDARHDHDGLGLGRRPRAQRAAHDRARAVGAVGPRGRRRCSSTAATRRTSAHWMRESGLADLLPDLDTVWVGPQRGQHGHDAADRR